MRKLDKIILGCAALGASTLGVLTGNFLFDHHYNKAKRNAPFYVNYFKVNGQTFVEYSDRQSKEGMHAVALTESGEINLEREETYEGGIFNLDCPGRECAVYAIDRDGFESAKTIFRRDNEKWSRVE